jgi:hypothetical protein
VAINLYDELNNKKIQLGSININLQPLLEGQTIDKWFAIDDSPFKGEIRVKVVYRNPNLQQQLEQNPNNEGNNISKVASTATNSNLIAGAAAPSNTNLHQAKQMDEIKDEEKNPDIRKLNYVSTKWYFQVKCPN